MDSYWKGEIAKCEQKIEQFSKELEMQTDDYTKGLLKELLDLWTSQKQAYKTLSELENECL